jgi:hypothetical protein
MACVMQCGSFRGAHIAFREVTEEEEFSVGVCRDDQHSKDTLCIVLNLLCQYLSYESIIKSLNQIELALEFFLALNVRVQILVLNRTMLYILDWGLKILYTLELNLSH